MSFSARDRATILHLAEKLTGVALLAKERQDFFLRKVAARVFETGSDNLKNYLQMVATSKNEFEVLISNLTIHTTSWFRELPHFRGLEEYLVSSKAFQNKILYVWSAACSTGEEVYSLALLLWHLKQQGIVFDFRIVGSDIDVKSITRAQSAIYLKENLKNIESRYHKYLLEGKVDNKDCITLLDEILARCCFRTINLLSNPFKAPSNAAKSAFDIILCRNVLIYFNIEEQKGILKNLTSNLKNNGLLVLGHSDTFFTQSELVPFKPSMYFRRKIEVEKLSSEKKSTSTKANLKNGHILVLDATPVILTKISALLEDQFHLTEAKAIETEDFSDPKKKPQLIVLDMTLSEKGGVHWLTEQRKNEMDIPVVVICESTSSEAVNIFSSLETGVQEFVTKKSLLEQPELLKETCLFLIENPAEEKLTLVDGELQKVHPFRKKKFEPQVIVIGASTGGPAALAALLKNMPKGMPPIIVVQHISPDFAQAFAYRLSQIANMRDGFQDLNPFSIEEKVTALQEGCLYIAKGDYHLRVIQTKDGLALEKSTSRKTNGHRPSVDVLFESLAVLNIDSIAVILTGMGQDGALGMFKLVKTERCFTMAQDQSSSVVYGMPQKAIDSGAACYIGNLIQIRAELMRRLGRH